METDLKLSAKEGQKLWANFRKYAQYDELKDLYRKTMPAISSFEDKLKDNNDHNDRLDVMLRRIDEVLCNKADKQQLKEFREDVSQTYVTKTDNGDLKNDVNKQIVDFTERITEMDTVIKFQVRQL